VNENEKLDQMPPEIAELSPGTTLRVAREARGLSVADIAQSLKFSERQIEALESNQYAQLPGAPFVRGFIRSYSRLVKIDSAPLITRLEQIAPPTSVEVVAPDNMGDAAPKTSMSRYAKLGGAVCAVLAAMAAGYFWSGGLTGDGDREHAESLAVSAHRPPSEAVDAIASSAVASSAATAGHIVRHLIFEFDEKSWLEVKDASNTVILTGEFPRGSHQEVTGTAPLQLWVGNAPVVRVSIEDHALDLQPHSREGVARLTVD
jgi:cytoskeleton protein RodZ